MDRDGPRPKSRRKLSKNQIIDILERNVQLYKEEDNFIRYLVELTVYLMEYEYDWAESGGVPGSNGNGNGNGNGSPAAGVPAPENTPTPDNPAPRQLNVRTFESITLNRRTCPYCGTIVGDLVICPSCRNVTR